MIAVEPRIRNLILALDESFKFTSLAPDSMAGITAYKYANVPRRNWHFNKPVLVKRAVSLYYKILQFIEVKLPVYRFWNKAYAAVVLQPDISLQNVSLIVCAHPWNMPIALKYKSKFCCPIILDLYEYYPGQFPDKEFVTNTSPYYDYLIRKFAYKADMILFAAPGFKKRYKKEYGIDGIVFPCAAPYYDPILSKKKNNSKVIRMVHHGIANPSRKIEGMIACASNLPNTFMMDFFLVESPAFPEYYVELKKLVAKSKNISIREPIPFGNIVETISTYDVGIYLLPPESINQELLLPNKIFEFIQARLFCVVGPSKGFSDLVLKYDIGIVSDNFSSEAFVSAMLQLNHELILNKRKNLDYAARELALENYFSILGDAAIKLW